ncbi:MAG: hypothetical protein AAFO61_01615 [Pseudomonadota bacterium]
MSKIRLFLTCLLLAFAAASPAKAALLDSVLQHKTFPLCHDKKVLGSIVERFNWAEKNTWHRGFTMSDVTRVRERLVRDNPEFLIPRRYCRAHSHLTNGTHPTVFYMIEGGQGFAGNGFHVVFCVGGLDPWRENNGSCRLLRY